MKALMNNTKKIAIRFAAICLMAFSFPVIANAQDDLPAQLRLLTKQNDKPVFQLFINNAEAGQYSIAVKDGSGTLLHKETISGIELSRKYALDITSADLNDDAFKLSFEVTNMKSNEKQVYTVTNKHVEATDLLIAKL